MRSRRKRSRACDESRPLNPILTNNTKKMNITTNKTIADYVAGLQAARLEPVAVKSKLEAFESDCQQRVDAPIESVSDHVGARLDLAETQRAIIEYEGWPIESRQRIAAEEYLEAEAPSICRALRGDMADRSKPQSDFIASKLKQAAGLTINLFASKTDRHIIYRDREAAEQAAEDAEAMSAAAVVAVRSFELMPNEQNFHAAIARVNEIVFPLVNLVS